MPDLLDRRSMTFWIPGTPKGQGRPDVTVKVRRKIRDPITGGYLKDERTGRDMWEWKYLEYPIVRSDPESRVEGRRIRKIARDAMRKVGFDPLQGPVCLVDTIVFLAPVSWTRKKRETTVWHTDTPDATNVVKLVEDAGNQQQDRGEWKGCSASELAGVLWTDDAQVASQHAMKVYGCREGQLITICELDPCSLVLRPELCQGVSWVVTPQVAELIGRNEQIGLGMGG